MCESGKQPTTGSQSKFNPVPVTIKGIQDWCKWMKSALVTATKMSSCECYEWRTNQQLNRSTQKQPKAASQQSILIEFFTTHKLSQYQYQRSKQ